MDVIFDGKRSFREGMKPGAWNQAFHLLQLSDPWVYSYHNGISRAFLISVIKSNMANENLVLPRFVRYNLNALGSWTVVSPWRGAYVFHCCDPLVSRNNMLTAYYRILRARDSTWPVSVKLTNWRQFFCGSTRLSPRGSTATLTMLWRNSWSITGQTHEKLTSICFLQ